MNERIKKLRRYFELTQQEFANRLGTTRNNIAGYEVGRRSPSEAVISLICREFNVNEHWLRTGEGGMFVPESNDTLGTFIRERNLSPSDRILIEKFVSLKAKARWEVVKYVLSVADALWEECSSVASKGLEPNTHGQELTDEDIERKIEDYRQHLLLEKSRVDASSPSNGHTA